SDSISLKKGDIITLIDSADTNNSDVYVDNDSVLEGTAKVYRENGESKNSDSDTNDIILEMLDDLIILEPEVPTSDFLADSDMSNIAEAADGKLQGFIDNVSETFGDDTKMATNAVNTMASANILAGTQHAAVSVTNHITNSIYNSVDVINRPKLSSKNDIVKLRDVCTDKDICKCDVVELGKQSGIMPVRRELAEYDKQAWASIVHSKEKIEGMKTGSLEQDSTVQYNGTTAGADLWSSNKGFGGVALTYADGNTESSQKTGNIRNDADYYGVSVYHRQDIGNIDIVSDISYTHTDNDITTDIAGNEITARPKVDVYSAGTKIEAELRLSKASKLVPYLGARYSRLQNKDFTNSLGGRFDVDNANLFTVPVGLALRSHLKTSEGWDFGSILEGGYEWNLGDRDSTQKFSYGGAYDIIGFDMVDSGQYYIKAALTAAYQNLLFELLYRYSKGKTTRDNNWRLNVNWGF
ncbi:MAG: autotransporter outer membrane beta-barrel domain-containing protein, partial [Phascolarctobacterium sp.]|nr:autotransporter outer membrane beta-barrel domain-containing protein [Candidatus Phascolarctobacterium caballi]